jgi:speckle-type POZ protein
VNHINILSFFSSGVPCGSYPKAIHVSLMGRVKSVNEISRGSWGPVRWSNYSEYILPTTDTNYRYRSKWPVFQIFVEFPTPPGPTKPTCTPGERQVLSQLAKLLDSQALADVHFNIKGHQIVAHTAIVASGSPVFSAMFEQEHFKEASTKAVDIEDIEPDVFQQMLRFLYAGVSPQLDEADMTEPLFLAADKYQIELLKEQCETSLIDKMDVSNAVRRLVLAYLHSAPNLMEASLKCLIKHKDEVWNRNEWKELMKSYQDLFYLAANRMVADRSCNCSPTNTVKV